MMFILFLIMRMVIIENVKVRMMKVQFIGLI